MSTEGVSDVAAAGGLPDISEKTQQGKARASVPRLVRSWQQSWASVLLEMEGERDGGVGVAHCSAQINQHDWFQT